MNDRHQGGGAAHTESSDHELDAGLERPGQRPGRAADADARRERPPHRRAARGRRRRDRAVRAVRGLRPRHGARRAQRQRLPRAGVRPDRRVVRVAAARWGGAATTRTEPNWYVERPVEDAKNIAALVVGRAAPGVRRRPPAAADLPGLGPQRRRGRRARAERDRGRAGRAAAPSRWSLQPEDRDDLAGDDPHDAPRQVDEEPDRRRRRRRRAHPPRPAGVGAGPRGHAGGRDLRPRRPRRALAPRDRGGDRRSSTATTRW